MESQTKHSRVIAATPFYYGWVILVIGTLGLLMMGPSQGFTVSLFLDFWVQDLGLSRSAIALFYGIATLGASVLLPLSGRLVDRFGSRAMVVVTSLSLAVACVLLANVRGAASLILGALALRLAGFGSLQIASNNVIAQWFIQRRGLAMGVAGQSLSLGLLIYPWLGEWMIDAWGWRSAWLGFGLLTAAVMTPLGWLFFRDSPEQYGLEPDGLATGTFRQKVPEDNWRLEEARRTPAFWVFFAAFSAITLVMAGVVFHQFALFAQRGFPREVVVQVFQVVALFTMLGNIVMGRLVDRYSPRKLVAAGTGFLLLSLAVVQVMSTGLHTLVFASLIGLAGGSFRVLDATVWPYYFGRLHLGSIRGTTMVGTMAGTAIGAYPLGLSIDFLGSYGPALGLYMGLLALMCAAVLLTGPPQRPVQ